MSFSHKTPYIPAVTRHAKAHRQIEKLKLEGFVMQPVLLVGRQITDSFWGKEWCEHIESFHDYVKRLDQGRVSVRNGSVAHLEIRQGRIEALVTGSSLYRVSVTIEKLPEKKWDALKYLCSGRIGSLSDLLHGKLDRSVKEIITNRRNGIFPLQIEMRFICDCPDRAALCKHVATVLYAAGARLDNAPEMLFLLRGVNHAEFFPVPAATTEAPDTVSDGCGTCETVALPAPLTGNAVLAWRTAVGDSPLAFAVRLDVSPTTVPRWENAGGNPLKIQAATLIKLRKAWELTHS